LGRKENSRVSCLVIVSSRSGRGGGSDGKGDRGMGGAPEKTKRRASETDTQVLVPACTFTCCVCDLGPIASPF
jgi:hypothetical protein